MIERWVPLAGLPRYSVSNLGRVWDHHRDRPLAQGSNRCGYIQVKLQTPDGRKTRSVHRLVALSFFDCDGDGLDVNHIDGDKTNNCLWNLEFCTTSANMKHAYATGLVSMPRETRVRCVETNEEFRTLREAARAIGSPDHKSISRVLDHPTRRAKGFRFETINVRGGGAR